MDITRRCDYAYRMVRAVHEHGDAYVSVAEVAERERIPYTFARSIQHDLVKAGLLRTARGARGGVALGRALSEMTMLDVLEAMQGSVSIAPCTGNEAFCEKSDECAFHRVWCGANRLFADYMKSINLADLFEQGAAHPSVAAALGRNATV